MTATHLTHVGGLHPGMALGLPLHKMLLGISVSSLQWTLASQALQTAGMLDLGASMSFSARQPQQAPS